MPLVVWKLGVERRGLSADFELLLIWAVGSDLEEVVGRLGPAPVVPDPLIICVSSSESRVRSMALLWMLSFAAFSASLFASAPDAQAVLCLSRFLSSAA